MTRQVNGVLGDWSENYAKARSIEVCRKSSCLELFKQGMGFRKAAKTLGLKPYTVRDWCRRFKSGDESWASRDGSKFARRAEAKDLVKYRREIETFISGSGTDTAGDGSRVCSGWSLTGREGQMAGSAEHAAAIPLHSADGACERILAGGSGKKKEIAAVRTLVDSGRSVKDACRIAGIPRCSYYRARVPSAKAKSDAELVRIMCDIENDGHVSSTYGLERLTGEINNRLLKSGPELASKILRNGSRVNRKRVHRLMKEHDIHSRIRRRKHPDNYYKAVKEMLKRNRAPNILKRGFSSGRPMAKLTTDVTYIPCSDQKFIYLSPLFDLFNHEIVSYSISSSNSEDFVKSMLTALPPEALQNALVHNDQGSVYWSNGWVRLCEKLQIVRSMSRRGNCWDNALSENFFSALKADLGLTKSGYKTLLSAKEVKSLIDDYIPWYNTGRIQKKLNYMSPVQFREAFHDKSMSVMGAGRPLVCHAERVFLVGAAGARLGPSARPFGDGASPPLQQEVKHALDTMPSDFVV